MGMSEPKTLGLVIATRWEAKPLLVHFHFRLQKDGIYSVDLQETKMLACISGMGRAAARIASEKLVARGAQVLLSVGFCGALLPSQRVGDLVTDRLITVDQPARTPLERQHLAEHSDAVAVDMETRAVVETGTRLGVPIRVLRVVSDAYVDDLTPLFGKGRHGSVVSMALRLLKPTVWPLAFRLWMQSRIARRRLVEALLAHVGGSHRGITFTTL
jgi:nucleoside phosphorylase